MWREQRLKMYYKKVLAIPLLFHLAIPRRTFISALKTTKYCLRCSALFQSCWSLKNTIILTMHFSVTSAECERYFSTLRRLKAYLRPTMSSERESSLAVMNIHYDQDIDVDAVIGIFAQTDPRLADLLSTD